MIGSEWDRRRRPRAVCAECGLPIDPAFTLCVDCAAPPEDLILDSSSWQRRAA